jgi:putative membrane protein
MIHNLVMGLHIVAVIAWMAGLLYLPRLFVYHTPAAPGSELDATFKVMEEKLQKMIMRPAMVAVVVLGAALVWLDGWTILGRPWMLTKLAGVAFLLWWHHFLIVERKALARGERRRSARFWRMTNELPFLAAILAVLAVTTKFA